MKLEIDGWQVRQARLLHPSHLVLDLSGDGISGTLSIEALVDGEDLESFIAHTPPFNGTRVLCAEADEAGVLHVEFANGAAMNVEPLATREAWQFFTSTPLFGVVCVPGGHLEVFRSDEEWARLGETDSKP